MENISLFPTLSVMNWEIKATQTPLKSGTSKAKSSKNEPCFLNALNLLAATIPMSNKKMAKKPLKMSEVKCLIPID